MVVVTRSLTREVRIPAGRKYLEGTLALPPVAGGVVLFAHGGRIGTLLFDLLTTGEEDARFDIALLAVRLQEATQWLMPRRKG